MTSALDMSLDDTIKSNKKSSSRGRDGCSSGLGPARRTFKRGVNRTAPYSKQETVVAQVSENYHKESRDVPDTIFKMIPYALPNSSWFAPK